MTERRLVKGCCPHDCQDTCSWVAHVEGDRVVRVEGAREHPFTRGVLCAKINDYEKRTYAPDRLLYPLRRTGAKGEGMFERISWDVALDIIADGFTSIIAEHGGEALLPLNYLGSMGIVQRRALMRLFHALGASRQTGSICGAAGNVLAAEGHPLGFDPEQIVESRLVVVWGANILTTSHHHWHFIEEARRRNGATIVCIDPRRTRTAERCDRHLAVRPGTDRFLAGSLAHVMFAEGLIDAELAAVAADLDALRAEVAAWTPSRASDVCGIASEEIVRLAREIGMMRPATIRSGIAPEQTTAGEAFVRSLSALVILGGHWRYPGGGLFIEASPVLHEARAARPDIAPRPTRRLDLARLGDNLTSTTLAPPIKGLMVFGTNPAVVQPDVARVRAGLARDDLFTVVVEHFLTDTARYADVVLPSTTQLEHFDINGAWGHHYVSVNNPAIQPLGESKSHGELMRLLATKMGLDDPALHESDEEIAQSALPDDIPLEALKAEGWRKTFPARPELKVGSLRLSGITADDVPDRGNRLQLLTPKAHYFLNSSYVNLARQRRGMERPTLEMNAADAEARGLHDGERVTIRNQQGEVTAWLRVGTSIRPGVVSLIGKWWSHPAETSAVANFLTPSAWAPGGQPAYNDTFVDVVAAPLPCLPEVEREDEVSRA
jgi:anaerobic selenocysteine-containing dehydrogenase